MTMPHLFSFSFRTTALAAVVALAATGCNKPVDDATLTNNVHTALNGDASIAGEPIQPAVANGVVTLNGSVSNDTARKVASQDASHVAGVKQVINNLTLQVAPVAPAIAAVTTTTTAPAPAPAVPLATTSQERRKIARHETIPSQPVPVYTPPAQPLPPVQTAQSAPPPPPPPPPAPVYRDVFVPSGETISVRINQTLDSASTPEGATFSGVVASSVIVDGEVAIPAGSSVSGRVTGVRDAAHFKGSSMLSVELTGVRRRGESIAVSTEPYTVEGKGRGKNTAEKVGGGAAVGAILGGILGGGKGAAIGAGAGGAVGAGANGVTRGEQVQIVSESIVRFHLANGFKVRSPGREGERGERDNSGLQPREPQ
ncbi:MAG: BON domain-containing protein [Acidobacteriaceae bacterium]